MFTGEYVLLLRKKSGLTRRELSALSGVSESAIKQYETNKRQPRHEQIKLLADALKAPINVLLGMPPFSDLKFLLENKKTILGLLPPAANQGEVSEDVDDEAYFLLLDTFVRSVIANDEGIVVLNKKELENIEGVLVNASVTKSEVFNLIGKWTPYQAKKRLPLLKACQDLDENELLEVLNYISYITSKRSDESGGGDQ